MSARRSVLVVLGAGLVAAAVVALPTAVSADEIPVRTLTWQTTDTGLDDAGVPVETVQWGRWGRRGYGLSFGFGRGYYGGYGGYYRRPWYGGYGYRPWYGGYGYGRSGLSFGLSFYRPRYYSSYYSYPRSYGGYGGYSYWPSSYSSYGYRPSYGFYGGYGYGGYGYCH